LSASDGSVHAEGSAHERRIPRPRPGRRKSRPDGRTGELTRPAAGREHAARGGRVSGGRVSGGRVSGGRAGAGKASGGRAGPAGRPAAADRRRPGRRGRGWGAAAAGPGRRRAPRRAGGNTWAAPRHPGRAQRGRILSAPRVRLDAELVRRGLARSREQAGELVTAGRVAVAGQQAAKPATMVTKDAPITIAEGGEPDYVSRGGHRLAGALAAFGPLGLAVAGRPCLDAGASTGGFTDVLLRAGAAHVVAADVGYGQLAWSLRTDERVTVLDRVNVRALDPAQVAPPPAVVVADLSFISLSLVLPALVACAAPDADF